MFTLQNEVPSPTVYICTSQIYDTLNMHLKVLSREKDLAESSVRIE